MKVIKKDGTIEILSKEKLKSSIAVASTDCGNTINESDLNVLSNAIIKKLTIIRGEDGTTSTYEIISVTVEILKEFKFMKTVKEYLSFTK